MDAEADIAVSSLWLSSQSYLHDNHSALKERAVLLSIIRELWLHVSFVYEKTKTFDGCDGVKGEKMLKDQLLPPALILLRYRMASL